MDTRVIAALHNGAFPRLFEEIGWDRYTVLEIPGGHLAHLGLIGVTTVKWLSGDPSLVIHSHESADQARDCLQADIDEITNRISRISEMLAMIQGSGMPASDLPTLPTAPQSPVDGVVRVGLYL